MATETSGRATSAAVADPAPPPAPTISLTGGSGRIIGTPDAIHPNVFLDAEVDYANATAISVSKLGINLYLGGNFSYDADEELTSGSMTSARIYVWNSGVKTSEVSLDHFRDISVSTFVGWAIPDAVQDAFTAIFSENDEIRGDWGGDLIRGFAGDDLIQAYGGQDTVFGGSGNDVIYAVLKPGISGFTGTGATYLRGDDGSDYIVGGASFDDINGNIGNDTALGGQAADWVVGGKDQDLLFGEAGDDIVYGNLGDDTCYGGAGADIVRGGQGNDIVSGGDGVDWMSGDRGDDTVTGGAGADIFHTFGEAGVDRVTDFSSTEGDRIQLDPGTVYTTAQVGTDAVISMTGGAQMILVGVSLSSLPAGWIFGA